MKKFYCSFLLLVLAVFLIALPSAHAVSLSFSPSTDSVVVGDSFSVDILVAGSELEEDWFSGGNDLGGFQLLVNYDDTLLDFDNYTLSTDLGVSSDASFGDNGIGTIDLFVTSLELDLSFQPDSPILASLSFSAIFADTTYLTFSDILLSDYIGNELILDEIGTLNLAITNPVPEPSTIILLGTGLLGLGVGIKRRHKK